MGPGAAPVRLLVLFSDTGGGHRSAARAVIQALEEAYPGRFASVLCDPLRGPGSSRLLRWVARLYGPSIRWAPWMWGVAYHCSDSRIAMGLLRRTLLALATRPVAQVVAREQPAVIVSLHPLTGAAAVAGRERAGHQTCVVTVVTDLITAHTAWRYPYADRVVVPSAAVRSRFGRDGFPSGRCEEVGLPVASSFRGRSLRSHERTVLRRSLGLGGRRFLVVLAGGGEGAGGMARRASALLRRFDDVDVVALCGRNRWLKHRLDALAADAAGRLVVQGFVDNMADWLQCADVVVTKAGPGTIAEATCCGAPLVLTSHLPGQEKGNAEFAVGAGAGLHAPTVQQLVEIIGRLRRDPATVDAMRGASAGLGRPDAALGIADLLAGMVGVRPSQLPRVNLSNDSPAGVAGGGHGQR